MTNKVCVFLGSSLGAKPQYTEAAKLLGKELATRNLELVYGGASVGLMGVLAQSVLDNDGVAIGVLPKFLGDKEIAHQQLTKLHIVHNMHERKQLMADLADAFITLPGGLGTLEELFEVWTWANIGVHNKPIGLLNVEGFFDPLIDMLNHFTEENFLRNKAKNYVKIAHSVSDLLDQFDLS